MKNLRLFSISALIFIVVMSLAKIAFGDNAMVFILVIAPASVTVGFSLTLAWDKFMEK